jgi:transposase
MSRPQQEPLRQLSEQEERELRRVVKASSERVDVVQRAKALFSVASGQSFCQAAATAGFKERKSVSRLVRRFNACGLASLSIASGRGRKPTYTGENQARIVAQVQRTPDREEDQTATWSLSTLQRSLRKTGLSRISRETIRHILHKHGYTYQLTRTWCRTGYAERKRKSGTVTVYDEQTPEKRRLIELACEQGEAAGIVQLNEDEAGPYQAIPQPGASWQPEGHPVLQPHEYERGGTAKLLTLFRPATGQLRAKGVLSAPNAVLHPWLTEQLSAVLAEIEKNHPREGLPPEAERPVYAQWKTWLWPHETDEGLPPLRILLVWDNLAGHLTPDLVGWLFEHGVMPLYTPIGSSWLNMAESVQRIIVRRALAGQHPTTAQEVIDWLEQTVEGWNQDPTPFVWNGKRRRRRERARLRRLAASEAAVAKGYSLAARRPSEAIAPPLASDAAMANGYAIAS